MIVFLCLVQCRFNPVNLTVSLAVHWLKSYSKFRSASVVTWSFWLRFQGRQEDGEPENKKPSLEEDTDERHRLVSRITLQVAVCVCVCVRVVNVHAYKTLCICSWCCRAGCEILSWHWAAASKPELLKYPAGCSDQPDKSVRKQPFPLFPLWVYIWECHCSQSPSEDKMAHELKEVRNMH